MCYVVGKCSFTILYGLRITGHCFALAAWNWQRISEPHRSLPYHLVPGAVRASPTCRARHPPGVNHCHAGDWSGAKLIYAWRSTRLARGLPVPHVPSSPVLWHVTLLCCHQVCSCPSPLRCPRRVSAHPAPSLLPWERGLALSPQLHQILPDGDRCHTFTPLFSWLQGSPLKGETCGRSQRIPPKSETRSCHTAWGAAGGTGHAPHRLPPLGIPLHPQCDQHGRLCPGRVSPLFFVCISRVCPPARHGKAHPLWVMKSPVQPAGCTCLGSSSGWRGGRERLC